MKPPCLICLFPGRPAFFPGAPGKKRPAQGTQGLGPWVSDPRPGVWLGALCVLGSRVPSLSLDVCLGFWGSGAAPRPSTLHAPPPAEDSIRRAARVSNARQRGPPTNIKRTVSCTRTHTHVHTHTIHTRHTRHTHTRKHTHRPFRLLSPSLPHKSKASPGPPFFLLIPSASAPCALPETLKPPPAPPATPDPHVYSLAPRPPEPSTGSRHEGTLLEPHLLICMEGRRERGRDVPRGARIRGWLYRGKEGKEEEA